MHLIHIMTWLGNHPLADRHFLLMCAEHPVRMARLMSDGHYRAWLDGYLASKGRLPGDDLLLGS